MVVIYGQNILLIQNVRFQNGKIIKNMHDKIIYKESEMNQTENIFEKIEQWGKDRNFYGEGGAIIQSQFIKVCEEVGELAGNIARGKDIKDDLGDIIVVLTHIAKLSGTSIQKCIQVAYNDIKDRKGEFINGSFIKESDLNK